MDSGLAATRRPGMTVDLKKAVVAHVACLPI
jgi:hypothetical protein